MVNMTDTFKSILESGTLTCWGKKCNNKLSLGEVNHIMGDKLRIYYKCGICGHSGWRSFDSVLRGSKETITVDKEDFNLPFVIYNNNRAINRETDGMCSICGREIEKGKASVVFTGRGKNVTEGRVCDKCVKREQVFTCRVCGKIRPACEHAGDRVCTSCMKNCCRCHNPAPTVNRVGMCNRCVSETSRDAAEIIGFKIRKNIKTATDDI